MMTPTITYYFYCWLDTPQEEKQRIVEQVREHCPKQINQFNRLIDGHSRQHFTRLIEQQTTHLFDTNNNQHLAGKTVDKYQLLKLAGQGGMGTVYEAKRVDQLFEQRVAIKFYHAHLSKLSSPPFLLKEAQVLANLNHVSIPKVYDAGLYKDNVYIVMEYIEGETLDQYLAKTSLSSEQRFLLCLEICSAIEHAHQYGLLHADLKPENLLIDKNGKPKVLDFNIVQPSFIHHSPFQALTPKVAASSLTHRLIWATDLNVLLMKKMT
ncbi:serine/threonine-protein kinase [Vibrio sp. FNV 38]|nr:serine/threonine-protein kinase [Vibrio sp. FNV 38]